MRSLSDLMQGSDWRDVYFDSRDWAKERGYQKVTQPLLTFWNRSSLKIWEKTQHEYQADMGLLHNGLPVGSLGRANHSIHAQLPSVFARWGGVE